MKKIKYIIGIIILIVITSITLVYADYLYESNNVYYNNSNSTLNSTDVQGAIDELYTKVNEMSNSGCIDGIECTRYAKVKYDANGGTFTNGETTNTIYYNTNGKIISKSPNLDKNGNRYKGNAGNMPEASSGINDIVTIEGAESLEVTITYGTYGNSSYSYVSIYDGTVTPTISNSSTSSLTGRLYGGNPTTQTYTITGDTVQFFFYNMAAQSASQSNCYGYYAIVQATSVNYQIPSNGNNSFNGWNTERDGSGTSYYTEDEIFNMVDTSTDITLYAQFFTPICKRATSLHQKTCTLNDSYTCKDYYGQNGTITYGNTEVTNRVLNVGDAFDCDVNKDGTYDSNTERFYYVSDLYTSGSFTSATFNENYAVLIYYSSVSSGVSSHSKYAYDSSQITYNGAVTAKAQLPTTSQWNNISLKNTRRQIYSSSGATTVYDSQNSTNRNLPNFSYSGYAARLLTLAEAESGCNGSANYSITSTNSIATRCNFLFENTAFDTSSSMSGYWLETPSSSTNVFNIYYYQRHVDNSLAYNNYMFGVRPAIEVPKTQISY